MVYFNIYVCQDWGYLMDHVLITGGAGFIGSHLAEKLLDMDFRVTVVDNFSTGHSSKLSHILKNPHMKLINSDITLPLNLSVDYIFNLASRASPKDFEVYPQDILMTNSIGVRNMIELAQHSGARFFQASTSEVYGDPEKSPQDEEYRGNVSSTGIRSCYDEGKRFAEALLFSYYRTFNLDIRIARIFNTYGPRMNLNDGRVIPNFLRQAIKGEDVTIYGDGTQTRSFCYVDDLVEGFIKIMFAENNVSRGEVFNLGNPNPITMKELAEEVIELTGSSSSITYLPLPQDDPLNRCPDITKIKTKLGWEPKINRMEGLKKTIEYFRSQINS